MEISHGRARGERGAFGGYRGGHSGRSAPNWGSAMEILERSRSKGSAYRALVKGLPASASWQDLKVRPYLLIFWMSLPIKPESRACAVPMKDR